MELLLCKGHTAPKKPQLSPHKHRDIIYGARSQLTPKEDASPFLGPASVTHVQQIARAALYYARAVDNKLLVPLSVIGAGQA